MNISSKDTYSLKIQRLNNFGLIDNNNVEIGNSCNEFNANKKKVICPLAIEAVLERRPEKRMKIQCKERCEK